MVSGRNTRETGAEVGEHRAGTKCAPEPKNSESGRRRYNPWGGGVVGLRIHLNIRLRSLDFGL